MQTAVHNDGIIDRIEIAEAIIEIRKDGIMHTHMKLKYEVTLENALNIFEAASSLAKGKPFANLFSTQKLLIPSNEVRDFTASEERNKIVLADAFVIHSLPQKLVGNFYLKFNRPPKPTRLFTNQQEAIKWLHRFIPNN